MVTATTNGSSASSTPRVIDSGIPQNIVSLFCTPDCYRSNYKTHKKLHTPAAQGNYTFPPDTADPFAGRYRYTGPLRAVYPKEPVPTRAVPESIPRPDYVNNAKGRSFAEEIANRTERYGRILSKKEIVGMREVCRLGREVLDIAASKIAPGVTTLDIDAVVHEECVKRNAYPSPLGYHRFPRSVCTSVNEVICHGIPDARPLEDGDIVNLDVTLYYNGFHGDLNATYPVGTKASDENLRLMKTARQCLDEAIRLVKPGTQYKDLGSTIEAIAKKDGFSVNHTYGGHGINNLFHCTPNISHYAGNKNIGVMKVGQCFTIEPMICVGQYKEDHWPDVWTAVTVDGKASAQFEETMIVTETGVEVLTAAPGWTLPERDTEIVPL
ncbi:methionine aminopeptidase 1, variant [Microbotryum lychnidis-dioicae p1A1 Lamole]|uniref:Methionine aminopeptidase n=1 Tax=Microbotryum lychnidis-dioicae (strain p1A1 Lamole / MvSl-1064) TaxID=683840 RepID=U5HDQ5_USTV1|nr:methionine aminopeptidase 1, variant [Microbotryum lychnidis-dioicae p1A1 Lamole]|eukprot:KDE04308.1 methionine aminopeptidase 1, variant [Microbotryum lychnidis-dioicae p1A1 Lamole]